MPAWQEDNDDDRDLPQEDDVSGDDDETTMLVCPSCGELVYEEAEQCPSCGDWIMPRTRAGRLHWIWLIALVLALAGMMIFVIG